MATVLPVWQDSVCENWHPLTVHGPDQLPVPFGCQTLANAPDDVKCHRPISGTSEDIWTTSLCTCMDSTTCYLMAV